MISRTTRCAALFAMLAAVLLVAPRAAMAWKPFTHSFAAAEAFSDATDSDGKVTIGGHEYALQPRVAAALNNEPSYYNAGVIGPDGFPDIAYGQAIIHPGVTSFAGAPSTG